MEELKKPQTIGLVAVGLLAGYLLMEQKKSQDQLEKVLLRLQALEGRQISTTNLLTEFQTSKSALEEVTKKLSDDVSSIREEVDEERVNTDDFIEFYNSKAEEKYNTGASTHSRKQTKTEEPKRNPRSRR